MSFPALLTLQTSGLHQVQALFLLLLVFVILFALVADRLRVPYPIVLVIAGLALGFVPGMPRFTLDPDIVFFVILPPLLFSAAWTTSWREFRFHLVSITMLAFGLVGFTVAGVALAAPHFLPGFDWRLGFLLGAVVAPTDAIAAAAVAQKVGMPRSILDLLEGESLLNDATGLLALEFGLAILLRNETPSLSSGALRLLWLTTGGVGTGLVAGFLVDRFERRVEYTSIEIVLSLLVPYGTYLSAEAIHASGVLAVVAAGLFIGRRSTEILSPQARLQGAAVWEALTFALNGVAFILIGLQLPAVRAGIKDYSLSGLFVSGLVFSVLLIVLRIAWTFPGAWLSNWMRRRLFGQPVSLPPARQVFVVGWTGMRGVISLAAALSLPTILESGQPFPERNFIVFLTFIVILVTLVLQGLTLPQLIRALGLVSPTEHNGEELEARRSILQAALARIGELREQQPQLAAVLDHMRLHYSSRLRAVTARSHGNEDESAAGQNHYREVSRELVAVERQEALRMRNSGQISDEVFRQIFHELDLAEAKLVVVSQ